MATWLQCSATPPGQQDGQILGVVRVPVPKCTSVENHRIVKQCSLTFLDGFEFFQEVGQLCDVVAINRFDFSLLFLISLVMGEHMVSFRDADLGITAIVAAVANHERNHAGRIGLIGNLISAAFLEQDTTDRKS